MDHVQTVMLKRGLYILGDAGLRELAAYAGADRDEVAAYLATRGDLVELLWEGGPWRVYPEARDALREEIRAGVAEDPERLSELADPEYLQRVRNSVAMVERLLDALPAKGGCAVRGGERDWIALRIGATEKALDALHGFGKDVADERARLAVCRARHGTMQAGC